MSNLLARVRNRRARRDRRAAVGALLKRGGARGAGEEVVARPEEDRPRRVGFHADRAEEAVLERLLLALDLRERAGGRVRRGLRASSGRAGLGVVLLWFVDTKRISRRVSSSSRLFSCRRARTL